MKKVILTLCLVMVASVGAFAQKGEKAVGVGVAYGTQSSVGIGVKGQYNVIDHIRLEAGFDYFFKNSGMSMWDINVNAHYLFPIACDGKLKVYPLVGLSYSNWKVGTVGIGSWRDSLYSPGYLSRSSYGDIYGDIDDDDYDASSHTSHFGVNIGAGLEYDINKHFAVNLEVKGQCMKSSQFLVSVGVAYKF